MKQSYRDLIAWHKAMELVTEIYRVTQNFPKEELFGLMSQLRRSAVSIPSNIAEGLRKIIKRRIPVIFRECQRLTLRVRNADINCQQS